MPNYADGEAAQVRHAAAGARGRRALACPRARAAGRGAAHRGAAHCGANCGATVAHRASGTTTETRDGEQRSSDRTSLLVLLCGY